MTGFLPQQQAFRDDSGRREVQLLLMPTEDNDDYRLTTVEPLKGGRLGKKLFSDVDRAMHERMPDTLVQGLGISPWGVSGYPMWHCGVRVRAKHSGCICAKVPYWNKRNPGSSTAMG